MCTWTGSHAYNSLNFLFQVTYLWLTCMSGCQGKVNTNWTYMPSLGVVTIPQKFCNSLLNWTCGSVHIQSCKKIIMNLTNFAWCIYKVHSMHVMQVQSLF
jgi:hypothetical protein